MNRPALIRYHDSNLNDVASISIETATHFADFYGLDFVDESTGSVDRWSYKRKIELSIRELNNNRPWCTYVDCDIVFNKNLDQTFLSQYTGSFSILNSIFAPETSFFVAYPSALPFLNQWSSSYTNFRDTDEASFMSIYQKSASIRNAITLIPSLPYIPSPFDGPISGSIGKHFYASSSPESVLFWMQQYKKKYYDNA